MLLSSSSIIYSSIFLRCWGICEELCSKKRAAISPRVCQRHSKQHRGWIAFLSSKRMRFYSYSRILCAQTNRFYLYQGICIRRWNCLLRWSKGNSALTQEVLQLSCRFVGRCLNIFWMRTRVFWHFLPHRDNSHVKALFVVRLSLIQHKCGKLKHVWWWQVRDPIRWFNVDERSTKTW